MILTNSLSAQISYSGFIDKYPIELTMYGYSDNVVIAVYAYDKYDTPIEINGNLRNNDLVLNEKDEKGNITAKFVFHNYNSEADQINGVWKDSISGKELDVRLTKSFEIDYGDDIEWSDRELMQTSSLNDKYFKVVVSKAKGDFFARVTGLKIYEKKSDNLLQYFDLECQLMGINSVSIGDYNFDGIDDFSVFEASYAGPNTSSLYFLYDTKTKKYFLSGFGGTSLDFDSEAKRIYEHNQCCAGRSHMNAEYKVVNNQMVLVKKVCIEYNDEKEDFDEVPCE